jgi:hypothetical protein
MGRLTTKLLDRPSGTREHNPPNCPSRLMKDEIEEYRKLVEKLASSKAEEVFSNGQSAHAAIIFETFFRHAKQRVNIFCRNLASDVFSLPQVAQTLEMALLRGVKVKFISQERPGAVDLADKIEGWSKSGLPVQLVVAPEGSDASKVKANFAVMDQRAFRFEIDREEPKAFASMNQPQSAKQLDDVFFARLAELV